MIEAELFAATGRTPCTVWPRTVMRGKSRKLTSGHNSVPKSARRTEPSPRNPRFAARPKGVAAQRKVRGVKRGQETILGVLSPFVSAAEGGNSSPVNTGVPAAEGGNFPPPWARRFLRRQTAALPAAEGGNSSPVNTGNFPPPPGGGNHSLHLLGNPL